MEHPVVQDSGAISQPILALSSMLNKLGISPGARMARILMDLENWQILTLSAADP